MIKKKQFSFVEIKLQTLGTNKRHIITNVGNMLEMSFFGFGYGVFIYGVIRKRRKIL